MVKMCQRGTRAHTVLSPLPDDTKCSRAFISQDRYGDVVLMLTSAEWSDTPEGEEMLYVSPQFGYEIGKPHAKQTQERFEGAGDG